MAGILRNFQAALKNVFLKIKKDVHFRRRCDHGTRDCDQILFQKGFKSDFYEI